MNGWTSKDSLELYGVPEWGADLFSINEKGNISVQPQGSAGPQIDLMETVKSLEARGMRSPMLIRFSDILASRIQHIHGAFDTAINDYEYRGQYRGVYPIKVNQQHQVVEEIIEFGAESRMGLEAGSRPELLIALALLDTPDALLICNGYKDRAYVETALLAQRLGRRPIIVIDRYRELERVIEASRELGIRPHLGLRAKLTARGAGKWAGSTGAGSKFGLSPAELLAATQRLEQASMLDCLELLHVHAGSQITSIQAHKEALREVSRIYVGLHQQGAPLGMLDVGGGLGVDYDGSKSNFHSSVNYSVQEYANDVVATIQETCDEAGIESPDIITESGRALSAHHSVLIFDTLEVNEVVCGGVPEPVLAEDHKVLHALAEIWSNIQLDTLHEAYHNVAQLREETSTLFSHGYINLEIRSRVENLASHCYEKILGLIQQLDTVPEDLTTLERELADTFYGNFSVFQSAPDHWAVGQLFPVMPIHRLDEEPTRRAIIADLTCDSDGKIDKFIAPTEAKDVLPLHRWTGAPYYIGMFLVGAYQEILGDLHNLFGDTNAVHVRLDAEGMPRIEHIVEGDLVDEVLSYVQYETKSLTERVRATAERALRAGQMSRTDANLLCDLYEQGLREYTYLSRDD